MVTSPLATAPATATVARTRALGVVGATLAAVVVWTLAVPILGVHLITRFGNADAQDVGIGLVITGSLIGSLAGLGLLVVLERISSRAMAIWTVVAIGVLVVSLSLPLVAGTTTPTKATLALMHVAVAIVLIATLRRR